MPATTTATITSEYTTTLWNLYFLLVHLRFGLVYVVRSQVAAGSRVLGKCWSFKVLSHGHLTLTDSPVEGDAACGLEAI